MTSNQVNCQHIYDGWCFDCVGQLLQELASERERCAGVAEETNCTTAPADCRVTAPGLECGASPPGHQRCCGRFDEGKVIEKLTTLHLTPKDRRHILAISYGTGKITTTDIIRYALQFTVEHNTNARIALKALKSPGVSAIEAVQDDSEHYEWAVEALARRES